MNIMIIHGPNMNLLGKRNPDVYGNKTLKDVNDEILQFAKEKDIKVDIYQTSSEGKIIDLLHKAQEKCSGVVLNPAAYTHYSYAIGDAIEAISVPVVEVHLSNIHKREEFRRKSVTAPYTIGQISGFGSYGYIMAIQALIAKKGGGAWKD